jgi:predicted secreted hydrolase
VRASVCLVLVAVIVAACAGGPVLANPPAQGPAASVPPEPSPLVTSDPQPIVLPQNDAPHDRLTEWWYYTGHLDDAAGHRFGFEFVIFRAERGSFPVAWASHLAITDEGGNEFVYAQRSEVGPQVAAQATAPLDLSLAIRGAAENSPWSMIGTRGKAELDAQATSSEASSGGGAFGLDLFVEPTKAPALHDGIGWIDFGPGGSSYYYSRTAMDALGTVTLGGRTMNVEGSAWFDHQWGDFIAVGGGGWDWFAVNLDDGTDFTLSLVRGRDGSYPLVYGTAVDRDATTRHLERDAFTVDVTDRWTSPTTGATYPAGWHISIPSDDLVIDLTPTVADQELDTRPTSGVVYWEGSQKVRATREGRPLGGEAYVELTGYGPG